MQENKTKVKNDRAEIIGAIVVFSFSVLLGFYGYLDRFAIFHDEIINTFRANEAIIFDYALRPAFYGINFVLYNFFGHSPFSLLIGSMLVYVITTVMLFIIGTRSCNVICGFACAILYMTSPLVLDLGIRGMPHIYAGLGATSVLFFFVLYSGKEKGAIKNVWAVLAGASLSIALMLHPTMLGFVAICFGLLCLLSLFSFLYQRHAQTQLAVLANSHLMALSFVITFLIANVLYWYFYGKTYVVAFLDILRKTQEDEFARYHQPFDWYFIRIFDEFFWVLIALSFLIIFKIAVVLWNRLRGSKRNWSLANVVSKTPFYAAVFSSICVMSIGAISLNDWKFDRVLVSFVPLAALSLGLLVGYVSEYGRFVSRVLMLTISLGSVLWVCGNGINAHFSAITDARKRPYVETNRYHSLYAVLRDLAVLDIGVISGPAGTRFIDRYLSISNKNATYFPRPESSSELPYWREAVRERILKERVQYMAVHRSWLEQNSPNSGSFSGLREEMRFFGGTLLHDWRSIVQVWKVEMFDPQSSCYSELANSAPRARIGLYPGLTEVSEHVAGAFDHASDTFGLRQYSLNARLRDGVGNLYYLNRNMVDYVVIPSTIPESLGTKVAEFEISLDKHGWREAGRCGPVDLRLWIRG